MLVYKNSNYKLGSFFDCCVVRAKALFFFKGQGRILILRIPSFFFLKEHFNMLALRFAKKSHFKYFMKQFFFLSTNFFFFLRLRVRGLGYRIKSITPNFFRFYIGTTNLYFFHAPVGIYVRVRRRRMLLISQKASLLNLVFAHLLLLKQIIPYKLRGVFFPKQIILLKPGKKSF